MRKTILIAATVGFLAPATYDPAAAQSGASLLNTCIRGYQNCTQRCTRIFQDVIPWTPGMVNFKNCLNKCDTNHAVCVDRAFSRAVSFAPPAKPRPKRPAASRR
jgi:hypothetical protein